MHLHSYLKGTHLVDLHALNLKSDEIIDLLERFKMDVIYDFDRLNEGTPDKYFASAPDEGFELQFDERHVLNTIWCYTRARGRFSQIDPEAIGVYIPKSWPDAKQYALKMQSRFSENTENWLRVENEQLWVHYEFSGDVLTMITLMSPCK